MVFDVKIFNRTKDIFEILSWEVPLAEHGSIDRRNDTANKHILELWDAGFNLDDWDMGIASKIPLHTYVDAKTGNDLSEEEANERRAKIKKLESDGKWEEACELDDTLAIEWKDGAGWIGSHMESYCVGCNYCYFNGYHWYTVHHA